MGANCTVVCPGHQTFRTSPTVVVSDSHLMARVKPSCIALILARKKQTIAVSVVNERTSASRPTLLMFHVVLRLFVACPAAEAALQPNPETPVHVSSVYRHNNFMGFKPNNCTWCHVLCYTHMTALTRVEAYINDCSIPGGRVACLQNKRFNHASVLGTTIVTYFVSRCSPAEKACCVEAIIVVTYCRPLGGLGQLRHRAPLPLHCRCRCRLVSSCTGKNTTRKLKPEKGIQQPSSKVAPPNTAQQPKTDYSRGLTTPGVHV